MPTVQSLGRRGGGRHSTVNVTRCLSNLPPFLLGVVTTYIVVIALHVQQQPQVQQQQPPEPQAYIRNNNDNNVPSIPSWITDPRATRDGVNCDPLLLCAWSLDHIRTQAVSLALYHQFAEKTGKSVGDIPTVKLSLEKSYEGQPIHSEKHYNEMNELYEKADSKFLENTGIVKLNLPKEIHVIPMGEESYFRRSLRDADLVLDGFLRNHGALPAPGEAWLDFGGSHGRVAQIMAAAYPQTEWHVVDPIADTVVWAKQQLPRVKFEVMTKPQPPMEAYKDGQFQGIYAISVWSHYSEGAALAWFDEMYRVLAPGGRLWFSTHGHQALNFGSLEAAVVHPLRPQMMEALYTRGHYYFPMFGENGDWNVSDQHGGTYWGYGALTPEWIAAKVLNANPAKSWRLEYYGPGINENHQDAYVLTKLG